MANPFFDLLGQAPAPMFGPGVNLNQATNMIGTTLNLPRQALQNPLGGIAQWAGLASQGGEEGLRESVRNFVRGDAPNANPILQALVGVNKLNPILHLTGKLPDGVLNIATDVGTDPLSYLGAGLVPRATAAARSAPQLARVAPQIEPILKMLEQADAIPSVALRETFALPGRFIPPALERVPIPKGVKIVDEVESSTGALTPNLRDATNLRDLLFSVNATGYLKTQVSRLQDAITELKGKGHDLMGDTHDVLSKDQLVPVYKSPTEALQEVQDAEAGVLATIRSIQNPYAQARALDVVRQAERRSLEAAQQAFIDIERYKPTATSVADLAQFSDRRFREAWSQSLTTWRAARDVIGDLGVRLDLPDFGAQGAQFKTPLNMMIARVEDAWKSYYQKASTTQATGIGKLDLLRRRGNEIRSAIGAEHIPGGDPFSNASGVSPIGGLLGQMRQVVPDLPPDDAYSLAQRLTQRIGQIDALGSTGVSAGADISDPMLRETFEKFWPAFQATSTRLNNARKQLDGVLDDIWRGSGQTGPRPQVPNDKLGEINAVLQGAGFAPVDPSKGVILELADRALQLGNLPGVPSKVRHLQEVWPQDDLITGNAYDLVLDRVIRQHASDVGIDTGNKWFDKFMRGVQTGTAFYKEQALLSLTYPLTNIMGGLVMGKLEGVSPVRVMRSLGANIATAWRGEPVVTDTAQGLMSGLGLKGLPRALSTSSGYLSEINAVREFTKKGVTASSKIPATARAIAGAGVGAIAGGPVGAAIGAAYGLVLPKLSKYMLIRLGGGIENVLRQEAWVDGTGRTLKGIFDSGRLHQIVEDAYSVTPEVLFGRQKPTIVPDNVLGARQSQFTQEVIDTIDKSNGVMAPESLEKLLIYGGVRADRAKAAASQWAQEVARASAEGERFANKIHFNYERLNNIESFIREVAPFSTWAMKAFPFFARHIAERPVIAVTLAHIAQESERQRTEDGLTPRFIGSIHGGDAVDAIWSALLGRDIKTYFNPLRGIVPFSDTTRMLNLQGNEEPLEAILQILGGFGPGLHPALETPLRMAGKLGADEPAREYLRAGGPIRALTGGKVDLNAPWANFERGVRSAVSGKEVTDPAEVAILKRIDELAYQTGKGIGSGDPAVAEYANAKVTKSGPIWDRAKAEVERERNVRSLVGFGSQVANPQAVLSPEEEAIRSGRSKLLPPQVAQQLRTQAQQDPTSPAPRNLLEPVKARIIEISGGEASLTPQARYILDNPTAANVAFLAKEIQDYERKTSPEMQGFTGVGSPERVELQNLINTYNNPAAILKQDPRYKNASEAELQQAVTWVRMQENVPLAMRQAGQRGPQAEIVRYVQQRKDLLREQHPILDAWLTYQQVNRGQGSMDDFLKTYTP